ncbi:hypothetical protein FCI23_22215 [Actinacidiphila oryziradicis]|uniref:Uncharacterized protein n=1 Tax=Actinacidiphila oryziradicis TaxID=2571141 RepID=A0A4U0SK75_9ACTN|nr:hypothetical protein FCI23_22215 [Actinacidiphila oryziradicis]
MPTTRPCITRRSPFEACIVASLSAESSLSDTGLPTQCNCFTAECNGTCSRWRSLRGRVRRRFRAGREPQAQQRQGEQPRSERKRACSPVPQPCGLQADRAPATALFTLTDLCRLDPEDAISSAVRTATTLTRTLAQ